MKSRPILFSAPMVRTILDGSKTQTRRILKNPPSLSNHIFYDDESKQWGFLGYSLDHNGHPTVEHWNQCKCPYGQPGDQLWVRETWRTCKPYDPYAPSQIDSGAAVQWLAGGPSRINGPEEWGKTRVSIHMPRWASRITLEIIGIRVERLQEVSSSDAIAEGIEAVVDNSPFCNPNGWRDYSGEGLLPFDADCPRSSYRTLWESINGPGSWDVNPWIWVVTFKRIEGGAK